MIPNIGAMIGGYIIFRCIEVANRSKTQFNSDGGRVFVLVMAWIGVAVTGFLTLDLLITGSSPGVIR
jgi:hypothetical protein